MCGRNHFLLAIKNLMWVGGTSISSGVMRRQLLAHILYHDGDHGSLPAYKVDP